MLPAIPRPVWRVALLCALLLAGCSSSDERKLFSLSGGAFGTQYHLKVVSRDKDSLDTLAAAVSQTLDEVDRQMSTYREDSELSVFNRAPVGEWVPVSPELVQVVLEAKRLAELSGGAYDVTVGPVVDLWGFGPEEREEKAPTPEALDKALEKVGMEHLEIRLQPAALRKRAPVRVDLSSIAKGFAVDQVVRLLESRGIRGYLVEIGGEVRTSGTKPGGEAWRLGLEKPQASLDRVAQSVIEPGDRAVATSGDYRNYFEADGRRFSHLIDPRDGKPISHGLASVTVLDPSCMTADALATLLMVLGPEKGLKFAGEREIPAYFIIRDQSAFRIEYTAPFRRFLASEETE